MTETFSGFFPTVDLIFVRVLTSTPKRREDAINLAARRGVYIKESAITFYLAQYADFTILE